MLGPELTFADRDHVWYQGKKLLYLAGTDYHGMSKNPAIVRTAAEAAEKYGLNPTGSRATTGNHPMYIELERVIAEFFASHGAVVCPSGYLSNTILLQAIACDYDTFFIDEKAHSSLMDATCQFHKPTYRFRHLDAQDLAKQLTQYLAPKSRPLLLTDGVFPSQGEMAPLKAYAEILKDYGGKILIDDAHAMAVIGPCGRGSWEDTQISRDMVYQAGTLSKGFGVGGGVIAADQETIDCIHNRSLAFVGCTGLALPLAAAAIQSVAFLMSNRQIITDLQQRALALKQRFKAIDLLMPETPMPILSITFEDVDKNQQLRNRLMDRGIYPPLVNYPGAPAGGHFRFILTSHTTADQEDLLFETIESSL